MQTLLDTGNPALNLTDLTTLVPVRPTKTIPDHRSIYGRTGTFQAFDPEFRTPYIQNSQCRLRENSQAFTVDVK